MATSEPATRIGRYTVIKRIGAGGMGLVYAAYDEQLDRNVAVKLMRPGHGHLSPTAQARLLREAKAIARLSHPGVVAVYEAGTHDDEVFIAMEYVDGVTLKQWQVSRNWNEVLHRYLVAGEALCAAHAAGIVHRDFKADNVLIRGTDQAVRVLDFGLASTKLLEETPQGKSHVLPEHGFVSLTHTGMVMGTPAYMAPEQHSAQPTDARSDQFSFCVALYEALYGFRPFSGNRLEELRANVLSGNVEPAPRYTEVPSKIFAALRKGLNIDPNDRFPTMEALLAGLVPPPPRQRWRRVALGVAAAAAMLSGAWAWSSTASNVLADESARVRTHFERARSENAEGTLRKLRTRTVSQRWDDLVVAYARSRSQHSPTDVLTALKHLSPHNTSWLPAARALAGDAIRRGPVFSSVPVSSPIRRIVFADDGLSFAALTDHGDVVLWHEGATIQHLDEQLGRIADITFVDEASLALGLADGRIAIRDAQGHVRTTARATAAELRCSRLRRGQQAIGRGRRRGHRRARHPRSPARQDVLGPPGSHLQRAIRPIRPLARVRRHRRWRHHVVSRSRNPSCPRSSGRGLGAPVASGQPNACRNHNGWHASVDGRRASRGTSIHGRVARRRKWIQVAGHARAAPRWFAYRARHRVVRTTRRQRPSVRVCTQQRRNAGRSRFLHHVQGKPTHLENGSRLHGTARHRRALGRARKDEGITSLHAFGGDLYGFEPGGAVVRVRPNDGIETVTTLPIEVAATQASSAGDRIAIEDQHGALHVLDLNDPKRLRSLGHLADPSPGAFAWSQQADMIAKLGCDQASQECRLSTHLLDGSAPTLLGSTPSPASSIHISPNGNAIATRHPRGVMLWSTRGADHRLLTPPLPPEEVQQHLIAFAFHRSGPLRIATIGGALDPTRADERGTTLRVWQTATGSKELYALFSEPDLRQLKSTTRKDAIVMETSDGHALLWVLGNDVFRTLPPGVFDEHTRVHRTPDGDRLWLESSQGEGSVILDINTGQRHHFPRLVAPIAWPTDGSVVDTMHLRRLRRWDNPPAADPHGFLRWLGKRTTVEVSADAFRAGDTQSHHER